MASISFFLKQTDIPTQTPGNGFGPIDANHFNLTSLFTAQSDLMAYACSSFSVLLLNSSNSTTSTVNLICKPLVQIPGLPPIKYFIYRGLRSDSFSNNGQLPPAGTSKLIDNIRKSSNPNKAFSYDPMNDTDDLESVFSNSNNQFPIAKAGDSIGLFLGGSRFGFEIMLDEPGCIMTVGTAKMNKNVVDLTSAQGEQRAILALQTLAYLDPASFFSFFGHSNQGGVNTNTSKMLSGADVYQLVDNFATKNQVLVDIRSVLNLPYNLLITTKTIKISQTSSSASSSNEIAYSNNSWPFFVLQNSASSYSTVSGRNYILFKISVQADTGINLPMVNMQGATFQTQFPQQNDDRSCSETGYSSSPWTKDIILTLQSATDVPTNPVASYVRLQIYDQMISLSSQIPTALRMDRTSFNFNNIFAPSQIPTFKANTGTILSIRVNNFTKYGVYSNAGLLMKTGVANDNVGEIAFSFRSHNQIKPENTNNPAFIKIPEKTKGNAPSLQLSLAPENSEILSINNYINKNSDPVVSTNLFYNYLKNKSLYKYRTIKQFTNINAGKKDSAGKTLPPVYEPTYQTEDLATPALSLYNILLDVANNIHCIELRILDTNVLDGDDITPMEPFTSLAYTTAERTNIYTILNDASKFSAFGPKYFNYDNIQTVQNQGQRSYYYFDLMLYGLLFVNGSFIWKKESANVRFYSLDGLNFLTTSYSSAASTNISATVWNNNIIPDIANSVTNPFNDNAKFNPGLKDQLYSNLQTIVSTDSNSNRLLLGEIRDYLYSGDLDNLSFEVAFRLPFFLNKTGSNANILTRRIIPYSEINSNNYVSTIIPYFKNFETWYAYANQLRTFSIAQLSPLGRTGITNTFTNYIKSNPLSAGIYQGLYVSINPSFQKHLVPAWEARLMEDENRYNPQTGNLSVPGFHFPASITPSLKVSQNLYDAAGVLSLKSSGVISTQTYDDVTGSKGWGVISNASTANGWYIYKYTNDPSQSKQYVINKGVTTNGNNSGFTFGLGFDLGQNTLADFETYFNQYNSLNELQKEIVGEAIHKHADQAAALFRTFLTVMNSIHWPDYETAAVPTLNLIKTGFLVEGVHNIKADSNGNHQILMVYKYDGNAEFFDGGIEYMNEVEKAIFAAKVYNSGTSSVKIYSDKGKRFIHAVNTHDLRYLKIAITWSLMSFDRVLTMTKFINGEKIKNFYNKALSSL